MKLLRVTLVVSLFLAVLGGCMRHANDRTISAIPRSISQEIAMTERTGLQQETNALGLKLAWNWPGGSEQQRQTALITDAIHKRSYGIVVMPAGGAAIDTAVQNALGRGIPVVILRDLTSLREQPHLSFVLEDYKADAELVTQRLQQEFGCKGTVVIVGVNNYSENSVRRLDALESTMRQECPALKIAQPVVAPYGNGYVQIAAQHALATYPDLVSFIGLNERAGLGAESVLEGGDVHRRIAVISYDQSMPLLLRMRSGYVDAIVAQNMRGMGKQAVENIGADRKGKSYSHTVTLPPLLITRGNLDDAATQDWLQFNLESPS